MKLLAFADGLLIHSPFWEKEGFGFLMAKGSMLAVCELIQDWH
jgi:hypothetical protein